MVIKAILYVTARGLYRVHLNGVRAGDQEFTPGWTSYHKRLQYQVYDVTGMVKTGTTPSASSSATDGTAEI